MIPPPCSPPPYCTTLMQIDAGAAAMREQQRLVELHKGECEALLAGRECTLVGKVAELQRARSAQVAAEAERDLAQVLHNYSTP